MEFTADVEMKAAGSEHQVPPRSWTPDTLGLNTECLCENSAEDKKSPPKPLIPAWSAGSPDAYHSRFMQATAVPLTEKPMNTNVPEIDFEQQTRAMRAHSTSDGSRCEDTATLMSKKGEEVKESLALHIRNMVVPEVAQALPRHEQDVSTLQPTATLNGQAKTGKDLPPPKVKNYRGKNVPEGSICKVCECPFATGTHYGVLTCEADKKFFARAVLQETRYKCEKGGNCAITLRTRHVCRSCRFAKCLKVGMEKQRVQQKRERSPEEAEHGPRRKKPKTEQPSGSQDGGQDREVTTELTKRQRYILKTAGQAYSSCVVHNAQSEEVPSAKETLWQFFEQVPFLVQRFTETIVKDMVTQSLTELSLLWVAILRYNRRRRTFQTMKGRKTWKVLCSEQQMRKTLECVHDVRAALDSCQFDHQAMGAFISLVLLCTNEGSNLRTYPTCTRAKPKFAGQLMGKTKEELRCVMKAYLQEKNGDPRAFTRLMIAMTNLAVQGFYLSSSDHADFRKAFFATFFLSEE